jgi:Putative beta-barrel porin 2
VPSRLLHRTLVLFAAVILAAPTGVLGQEPDPPSNAPFQAGPLVLAPRVRLTNVGHDSNVFNAADNPKSDLTATFSPSMEGWFRMAHGRASGRSQLDVYYFKNLTNLRAVDSENSGHIEIPINRLRPYATGSFVSTRHRQNLEIDALARRRTDTFMVGVDVKLTAKLTAGLSGTRSNLSYDANSLYLGSDLSKLLNHKTTGEGANISYAVTPYTAVNVEALQSHDNFAFTSTRNSDNLRVATGVSFSPRALINGSASVGIQKRKFLNGSTSAAATGTFVATNLTYALRGRTLFTVTARRELEYSYLFAQPDYLSSGLTLFVTQRIGDSWEVGGSVGRYRLLYANDPLSSNAQAFFGSADETVLTSGGNVGYNLGHSKVGVDVQYSERLTDNRALFRGYQRLRISSNFTYAF